MTTSRTTLAPIATTKNTLITGEKVPCNKCDKLIRACLKSF